MEPEPDFSGWATKAGLKCTDGRTILPNAFLHQDKMTVPLVWHHGHNSTDNVLGHVLLENRGADGVYGYGFFNETKQGQDAKILVEHGDIKFLSIWANQLVEKSKQVVHGMIREVSLVLAGANPGAVIEQVRISHGDDPDDDEVLDDTAIIKTGLELELEHSDNSEEEEESEESTDEETQEDEEDSEDESVSHADDGPTVQEVWDTLNQEQQDLVNYLMGVAANDTSVAHAALGDDPQLQEIYDTLDQKQKDVVTYMIGAALEAAGTTASHSDNQEGNEMKTRNVFENGNGASDDSPSLSHDDMETIMTQADQLGSLKKAILAHAAEYGIEDIDLLFPDAKMDGNGISLVSRRMEWVQNVLTNTKHQPFSRIKSLAADLTADQARAKGYVKGNRKKEEVIKLLKRVTTPKTVYKKQKLDRDDILDITEIDVVVWLKAEMRVMLDEEIARAVLIGDGREADDEDKIDEDHVRPIAFDDDMYNTTIELDDGVTGDDLVDAIALGLNKYKGSGRPTLYTTAAVYSSMIMAKDQVGRRLYKTKDELAAALLVQDIVPVEVMEDEADIVGIVVNLIDYTIGADRGGETNFFENFDIDFNQEKYLLETRISGALTRPKSAVTFKKNAAHVVTPDDPTFVAATGVLTVPNQAGVVYSDEATGANLAAGAQPAIAPGATVDVVASPAAGYGFTHDAQRDWTFTRDA